MIILNDEQKMSLLLGKNIKVEDGLEVKTITIRDVYNIGYDKLKQKIYPLTQTTDDFIKMYRDTEDYFSLYEQRHNLKTLTFHKFFWLTDDNYKNNFNEMLSLILGVNKDSIYLLDPIIDSGINDFIIMGDLSNKVEHVITQDIFDSILYIFMLIIGLEMLSDEDDITNPSDDRKTQEILDKLKKASDKIDKIKNNRPNEYGITIFSIVSAVTTRSNNINKLNLKDHTFFQVFDEYLRIKKVDAYNLNVKATMMGGKDIEIQPWDS